MTSGLGLLVIVTSYRQKIQLGDQVWGRRGVPIAACAEPEEPEELRGDVRCMAENVGPCQLNELNVTTQPQGVTHCEYSVVAIY